MPEKPADKMRFNVAWPEYISKKRKRGEEGSRSGICRRSHRKSFLFSVVGLQRSDSMSPGFCFLIRNRMGCRVRRAVLRIKGDVCSMHPNKQISLTNSSIT